MEGGKREGIPGVYSGFRVTGMIEGFFGWLDLVGTLILGVFDQNNMEARTGARVSRPRTSADKYNQTCFAFRKFLRLGNSAWNFFGD